MEATTPPGASSHEFGPHENEVIGSAAKWIGYWSWIAIISGILMGLGGLVGEDPIGGLIMGAIYVIVGAYFRGAAASMREVVSTAGNDVAHLMTALDKLAAAFKVMVLLVFIGVVLATVVAVVVAVGAGLGG
ncbi:MAG: hypothetical protein R3253_07155 [Longimicrobiales bacterium]|nr:hypothetical protein [Longimicrobiales bacterium]